jgi:hypothetical protein
MFLNSGLAAAERNHVLVSDRELAVREISRPSETVPMTQQLLTPFGSNRGYDKIGEPPEYLIISIKSGA